MHLDFHLAQPNSLMSFAQFQGHRTMAHPSNSSSTSPPQYNNYPPQYGGNLYYPQAEAIKPPELVYGGRQTANVNLSIAQDPRAQITRTPSPTPSEARELESIGSRSGLINWKLVRSKDFWLSKEGLSESSRIRCVKI